MSIDPPPISGQHTILVTSRDNEILEARIHALETAGYSVVGATTIHGAMAMANLRRPDAVVIGYTFTPDEQAEFVEQLSEAHRDAHIIVLGPGVIQPLEVAEACTLCWEGQPRGPRVIRLSGDKPRTVLPWPTGQVWLGLTPPTVV